MYETLVAAVLAHGEECPDKMAIGFKATRITYRELCVQVKKFAFELKQDYSVNVGDMVMISAVSKPEYVIALLAVQFLGAVTVPIDKAAKETNILEVYDFISPKLLLTDSKIQAAHVKKASLKELYQKIISGECSDAREISYEVPDGQKLAEILFTTGTTGKPKGGMLAYDNIYASTHNTWHGIGMLESDVVLIPLPLNHSVGMRVLRTTLYIGATVILQNGFTFAKELERNITEFSCTGLVSVPASIEVVYRQMRDNFARVLGKLRYIEFGAGFLSYDMKKRLLKMIPNTEIHNTWGSTETGGAIFLNVTKHPDKLTSLGKPVEGVRLKIVDENGNEMEARDIDTAGRMVLQGKMQMTGYYKNPEMTAETLVDGWLYTNDLVYRDDEGYVYMLGRADDIINVGGEKVSPVEVENIAQENEQIRECACIGVEDTEGILGKIPVLFVVLETGKFDEKELVKFMAERMEKYKLPKRYIIVDELPRNRMQKLDRKALYRMWEEESDSELTNDVILAIKSRHSVREFTEEMIPRQKLETIVQMGIYAPSGHNMQTWRFTVIQNQEKIFQLKKVIKKVAEEEKVYFYGFNNPNAIVLISNDRRNENSIQDSACAAENIMLAANSFGIGSVWINALRTICDHREIRQLLREFGILDTHIVWALIAMGYPAKKGSSLAKKKNVVKWIE